jgi:hypothetical protein
MRRLDMEAGELNGVSKAGWSGGYADKVLDAFRMRKANASKAQE